jgi:predicted nuclease of predicted toxin-antitoxin system
MRFKVDENLPPAAAHVIRDHGHDAATLQEEKLSGRRDRVIAQAFRSEGRAFIPLDLDFADIRAYPPSEYAGIIVLRLHEQVKSRVLAAIRSVLPVLDREQLSGRLWVADEIRIRVWGEQ